MLLLYKGVINKFREKSLSSNIVEMDLFVQFMIRAMVVEEDGGVEKDGGVEYYGEEDIMGDMEVVDVEVVGVEVADVEGVAGVEEEEDVEVVAEIRQDKHDSNTD